MATPTKSGPARVRRPAAAKPASRPRRTEPAEPAGSATTKPATTDEPSAAERYARNPHHAAEKARKTSRTRVTVPMVGHVDLPPADELAYMAGIGALAVVGAVEWPVAVVLGAGHALANRRRNKLLREFGEALERA